MKMKFLALLALVSLCAAQAFAAVTVRKDEGGWRMFDGDAEVEIKGITWSNTPIGENYNYSLWNMDDQFIYATLDTDMPLLKAMGVNVVRSFSDTPPRWIQYIYETYGIYTLVNNLMGRYGTTVKGKWTFPTDYQDPATRESLIASARETAKLYKDVPGVLFYLLGNESNYGLEWSSTEIEDLPVGEQHRAKAVYLYSMFEEAMAGMKEIDPGHPVGIVNGDVQYIDLIAELCPSLDILGSNVYRGWKFYDAFYEDVLTKLDKPAVFTECGADAFNALTQKEDQWAQLQYLKSQWEELYQEAYGKGRHGNILGAFVFEFADEWWKMYQYKDLELHNENASWANSGYSLDYKEGLNNMNEEWFGLVAISPETVNGVNKRVPRAAYYFFCDLWKHSIYNSTDAEMQEFFRNLPEALYLAHGTETSLREAHKDLKRFRVESLSVTGQMTTPVFLNYLIDDIQKGKNWRDAFRYPNTGYQANSTGYTGKAEDMENKPAFQAESTIVLAMNPVESVSGTVTLKAFTGEPFTRLADHWMNYYGDVPNGDSVYDHKKYFDLYAATASYENKYFDLNGYYHSGHASYETSGDVFNITKEAFDIIGYDTYGSKAPIAAEFVGKNVLSGLSVIGGPEIYGGAAPQIVANYWRGFWTGPYVSKVLGWVNIGGVFAEELGLSERPEIEPRGAYGSGRKASVYTELFFHDWATLKLGVLHAGSEKVGALYDSTTDRKTKKITLLDTLGGYAQLGTNMVPYSYIYANAIYRGLVADTNAAAVRGGFFTDDSGSGNRFEVQAGVDFIYGPLTVKPVFRARMPLEGPTGNRSIIAGDPFSVGLGNRQSVEVEAVVTYDPEGGTWFHDWNNDETENAKIAFSVSGLYQLFAGKTDKLYYKHNESLSYQRNDGTWVTGDYWIATNALPIENNLWQVGARVVANPLRDLRLIGTLTVGHLGPTTGAWFGYSKEITFGNVGLSARYKKWIASTSFTINGWAPEAWHRDQNWVFPLQYSVDIAYGFKKPSFLDSANRIGIKAVGRNYGAYSTDGYNALPYAYRGAGNCNGAKYVELTTYLSIGL